jgi:hypothetical protein
VLGSVMGRSSQMNASVSLNIRTRAALRNLQKNTILHHISRNKAQLLINFTRSMVIS